MKYILSSEIVELLAHLAPSRVLVAFDFDGTLEPIAADRTALRCQTRTLLALQDCALPTSRCMSATRLLMTR